jgi:hypothetical protein
MCILSGWYWKGRMMPTAPGLAPLCSKNLGGYSRHMECRVRYLAVEHLRRYRAARFARRVKLGQPSLERGWLVLFMEACANE